MLCMRPDDDIAATKTPHKCRISILFMQTAATPQDKMQMRIFFGNAPTDKCHGNKPTQISQ